MSTRKPKGECELGAVFIMGISNGIPVPPTTPEGACTGDCIYHKVLNNKSAGWYYNRYYNGITMYYNGITMVLQWYYNGITMVLQMYYNGITIRSGVSLGSVSWSLGSLGVGLGSLGGRSGVSWGSVWGPLGVGLGSLGGRSGVTCGSVYAHGGVGKYKGPVQRSRLV